MKLKMTMRKLNMYSLIIPIYKNEAFIPELIKTILEFNEKLNNELEVIFVIDGSPDNSFKLLSQELPNLKVPSQLIVLSKNFGAFSAVRAGLSAARGKFFAVMAADLQEPPDLIIKMFKILSQDSADIVMGTRENRSDPLLSRCMAQVFWFCYRKCVQKEIPAGGIDIFACNKKFRDHLLKLQESNSSLISLIFWLGFRREFISYNRLPRMHGKSAWTFRKKLRYLSDSIFSFTDLPIRLLIGLGSIGILFSVFFAFIVLIAHYSHFISLPGYTSTILFLLFITAFNAFGLGIIGSYVWRTFENSKARPSAVIMWQQSFHQEE